MFIAGSLASRFPKFSKYVDEGFPTLVNVPGITFGLRFFGFMTQAEVVTVLSRDKGPYVGSSTGQFLAASLSSAQMANAAVRPPSSPAEADGHLILGVFEAALDEFEKGVGVRMTGQGRRIYIAGAHLLGAVVQGFAARHYLNSGGGYNERTALEQGAYNRKGFYDSTYGGLPA